jgi:histidine triad (HIT) family protein
MSERAPDCLFCGIAAGEVPADMVHEDDEVVAFRDVAPRAPTHVLVIPRRHVADADALTDRDGSLVARCFAVIRLVAEAEGLGTGYRIVANVGADAGQTVPHLHFHLLGGRQLGWPPC